MYTYRIVVDAWDSGDPSKKPARVLTYAQGHNRTKALRTLKTIFIAQDGTVSDGIHEWPGTLNLPPGPHQVRWLPEWEVVSMRVVKHSGTPRIIAE